MPTRALIERTVAIKALPIEPANAALQRWWPNCVLASDVKYRRRLPSAHPNVVSVCDYGEATEFSPAFIARS
jgi:hypothetical protein